MTIFEHAGVALPAGKPPVLAALVEASPKLDRAAVVASYRGAVSARAFDDPAFVAACWGCGEPFRRGLVGLACARCAVVVPVDERPALPRYVFGARVAQGGQGTVWRALYEPLADWRAVKAIPLLDAAREDRIREEARRTNELKHPRIPTVHDVLREDDTVYISMEWIEGETLGERRAPSILDALEWMRLAAEGVGVAHARGLVHRDLKPGNLMRAGDGAIKVVDFGLALPLAESSSGVAGTPAYMAPEVARGEAATPRSDVWSLGATLHALLTGRAPVEREADESEDAYLARRATATAPRAGPPEVAAILGKALALDPERRYPTATELARDLAACLDGRPVRARREELGTVRGLVYALGRTVDRNPVATVGSAILAIAAPFFTVVCYAYYNADLRIRSERKLAGLWSDVAHTHHATWRQDVPAGALSAAFETAVTRFEPEAERANLIEGLVERAHARRWRGDLAGAEADLRRVRARWGGVAGDLFALVLLERGTGTPAEIAQARRDEAVTLEPDERDLLEALSSGSRASLLEAQARRPSAELCLALARTAPTPEEAERWRAAGLGIAPGDLRLARAPR